MKIALAQTNTEWEDKYKNISKADYFSLKAKEGDADVIVFPEMSLTGFSMEVTKLSESLNGHSIQAMRNIAKRNDINVIFGIPTKQQNNYFNTLIVLNRDGNIIDYYNKIHTFSFAGEDKVYSSGEKPFIFKVDQHVAGAAICYDLRFPELFTYKAERKKINFLIANWPKQRDEHWQTLIKARALDSMSYFVAVNRVGNGGGLEYSGNSSIVNPWGEIIGCCGNDIEEVKIIEIDIQQVFEIRSQFGVLVDRKLKPHSKMFA